jgi:ribosomal protein S1
MSNDWNDLKKDLQIGTLISGTVERHFPFGIFVTLPGVPFKGLVEISDIKDQGPMTPSEYPAIGSTVKCVVLGFRDIGQEIGLGMKPSQLA